MKKALLQSLLAGLFLFFPITVFAQATPEAGCCVVTTTAGPKQCIEAAGLTVNAGETPSAACFRTYPLNATYTVGLPCSVACTATPTGSFTVTTGQCCVYAPGNCQVATNGICERIAITGGGQLTGRLQSGSCAAIDECGNYQLSRGVEPAAVIEDRDPIRFRVSVSLPGSQFLAGQSITITGETLGEYIAALYFFVVSAAGILAAGMIFYGGLQWLTAGGKVGSVQDAKDRILSALIGLGLAFGAYLILVTISPKLVKFNSLNIQQVTGKQQSFVGAEIPFSGYKGGVSLGTISASPTWYAGVYNKYNNFIQPEALAKGVDLDLMYAIMLVESGGNAEATSPAGACGLFQLLPSTAQPYVPEKPNITCRDLFDPAINAKASVGYVKSLLEATCPTSARKRDGTVVQCDASKTQCKNGDLRYVIAAYNGGQGANCSSVTCPGSTWWECEGNPGYAETRSYVQKVLSAYEQIKTFTP